MDLMLSLWGHSDFRQARPRSPACCRLLPFLCRWVWVREFSSPLVRARSGWLLLAASLLTSNPSFLSEPHFCREQG